MTIEVSVEPVDVDEEGVIWHCVKPLDGRKLTERLALIFDVQHAKDYEIREVKEALRQLGLRVIDGWYDGDVEVIDYEACFGAFYVLLPTRR